MVAARQASLRSNASRRSSTIVVLITVLVAGAFLLAVTAALLMRSSVGTMSAVGTVSRIVDSGNLVSDRPPKRNIAPPSDPPEEEVEPQSGGGARWPQWPLGDQKRTFMWVFVYCAGQPVAGPAEDATTLADLLGIAIQLDFQVLVCVPNMVVPPPESHHPRLHWLPKDARDLFEPDIADSPPADPSDIIANSPLGFLRQLQMINERLEFRKLLILSPWISLGRTTAEAVENIQRLWGAFRDRYEEGDQTSVTPNILGEAFASDAPTESQQRSATLPSNTVDRLRLLQKPPRVIIAHGVMAAEAVSGLVTLFPRLAGAYEGNMAATKTTEVDAPSGLFAILSKAVLDATLPGALSLWEAAGNGSWHSALPRPKWRDLTVTAKFTALLRADFALASLNLPRVLAVDARVSLLGRSNADPDRLLDKYRSEMRALAEGGPHVDPQQQTPSLYEGIDGMLPRIISMNLPLRKRVAHRRRAELLNKAVVLWDPYCSCTGINIEAINFITALERHVQVRAVADPACWCHGFPEADDSALRRMMKPKLGVGDEQLGMTRALLEADLRHSTKRRYSVWITHKPVDAFPKFPYHGAIHFTRRPSVHIGRTMIEVDRITHEWVRRINDPTAVDEVWVPSTFLVDAFYASGVKRSKSIYVVPEPIDVLEYDPAAAAPLASIIGHAAPCANCFKFFSNFKWEPRKGWDVLLRAYFTTFKTTEPVALYLKTYLYMTPKPRDIHAITQRIERYAVDVLHLDLAALPKFYVLPEESDAKEMPSLYASMDCFVLPTRGEGWGLPFQEALAMGLPTIGTRWGGNIDFMTDNNSFLIDVEGLIPPSGQVGGYNGARQSDSPAITALSDKTPRGADRPMFAQPSARHLAELMRYVVDNPLEAQARGRRGRDDMVRKYSRDAVADIVLRRVQNLIEKLERGGENSAA